MQGMVRRVWMLGGALWLGGAVLAGCESAEVVDGPVGVDVAALPGPVAEAYGTLIGGNVGLAERAAAAGRLVRFDDEDAAGLALAAALGGDREPAVWLAVAQAVATEPVRPPRGLWRALLTTLYRVEERRVGDVARALGRYDVAKLRERLAGAAVSANLPAPERARAIAALGEHRTQGVTERLMSLTDAGEPAEVQAAAFAALSVLSGIERYDADRVAWQRWWDYVRLLDAKDWRAHLLNNYVRRVAEERATDVQVAEKLRDAERALYLASPEQDQPRVLMTMLASPLAATRALGLDLAQTRLVADGAFDEALRVALRERLTDESADVRRRAALLLRDLADEPAADAVEAALVADREHVNGVLGAYLQLMARLPRQGAIGPAEALLDEPAVRAEAAGTLAAVSRAGLLPPKAAARVAERLRANLQPNERPAPEVVTLLGRVGSNDDWRLVERWVDSDDPVVKQAAARAWADSDRSLSLLADRAEDPVIQPIVIVAARQRGQDPDTLLRLAANRPRRVQAAASWADALVAMAGRVEPDAVLRALGVLNGGEGGDGVDPTLAERLLTAALEPLKQAGGLAAAEGEAFDAQVELLLYRARTRRTMGNAELALADYQRLYDARRRLDAASREAAYRGLITTCLDTNRIDEAFAMARELFGNEAEPGSAAAEPGTLDDPLMETMVAAAKREAELGRTRRARAILDEMRLLLGPQVRPMSDALAGRIAAVEALVK